jgi:hypothetical protein
MDAIYGVSPPALRKLKGYAFDPSLSIQLDTVDINVILYKVPWEALDKHPDDKSRSLPAGEYIEIIDYDPATGVFYPPVNLNDSYLLAQDGIDPSVSSPQFHQQMLYAVIMTTIRNFEFALGRKVQWAEHIFYAKDDNGNITKDVRSSFVRRLRVYPHALRQGNAYYNPQKKSLLFGYFPATPVNSQLHLPGGIVFTCLSHDIIAHETTHAILDGLHRRYTEPTHPDTRAFHEGFADIVALFQHFTFSDVLKQQIAKTRGDLSTQNLLAQLAVQFGKAMGGYGGLRDAIGRTKDDGTWAPYLPDPNDYKTKLKFHDRGAILVAAVFDAFLSIYHQRIKTQLRIATGGSGKLPDGELNYDLVEKLAEIASDTAMQILRICVRALDYCPPVDINFGDYLRAIITADCDMVKDDKYFYRIAFIEAFQKRGIFPDGIKSMSVESLCHKEDKGLAIPAKVNTQLVDFLKEFKENLAYVPERSEVHRIAKLYAGGKEIDEKKNKSILYGLHGKFALKLLEDSESKQKFGELTGLFFPDTKEVCEQAGFVFSDTYLTAIYEIGNLWLASRITPEDQIVNHVIVTLLQKRGVRANVENGSFKVKNYFVPRSTTLMDPDMFVFRGGATLIFDLDKNCLKYVIKKPFDDISRMEQQYRFANNLLDGSEAFTYFNESSLTALSGPFAFMHAFPHQH